MEILDLPMDIIWENTTASQYTFICNQFDEILATTDIEQGPIIKWRNSDKNRV